MEKAWKAGAFVMHFQPPPRVARGAQDKGVGMKQRLTSGPAWLAEAVFYEIYPQSFRDANGDGIGDLPGIIEKLDYLAELGVNALWLNPCFVSPFEDAGYDVADYYRVAPRYGTNADLKRLFRAAAARGIRVCLDLVPGHTSRQHPWFRQSGRAQKNRYSDWYIWTDDWLAPEGGGLRFIQGAAERNGSYAVNFFASQPALNYGFARPDPACPWQLPTDHPSVRAVRAEIKKIIRFWLDAGAAGFRVDMASSLVKNDPGHRRTIAFWRDVRAMLDRDYPDAALIAEWGYAPEALRAGFHADFLLHCGARAYTSLFRAEPERNIFNRAPAAAMYPYDTDHRPLAHSFFDRAGRGDITRFLSTYEAQRRNAGRHGYLALPSGNHDMPRLRQGRSMADMAVAMAFLLTMPGVPFLYYGDEIGLRHQPRLPSKEGGYTRTGARTPMQWSRAANAGFSSAPADRLYLPVDPARDRPNVADQAARAGSLLRMVRQLIRLRKSLPALGARGDFIPLYARPRRYPFVYLRRRGGVTALVALNPAARPARIRLPVDLRGAETLLARRAAVTPAGTRGILDMAGVSFLVARLGPGAKRRT